MIKNPVVNLGDLRRIINELLEHVEDVSGPNLKLEQDYYWCLDNEVAYDVTTPVLQVTLVGSLGDSWEFLSNMLGSNIREQGPSLMLTHVAPLLQYIGEKVVR